ncbi:hypothetical protein N656DRAFT_80356 [Canariomyces notabilis]|uniref:CHAT domain-containing protein n=1 Tax=Canariomyces notabilis TaxID=2074819 RepID=A0AAN6TED3_9PEZI|nr:hypothetical protein N656DRAFT_80356 [Canariomyces arenarius]
MRGSNVKSLAAAKFGLLMRHLENDKRYYDIHTILASFLTCTAANQCIERLESMLASEDVPNVFRGLWLIALAKQLAKASRIEDMKLRLEEADRAFQSCAHRWGLLETRLLRLQHGLATSPNTLADLVDLAREHLQASFPYGVLQTILQALNVAFNMGDFAIYFKLQETLHSVCTSTGLVKEKMLREIQLLAALNASSGDAGKVLELGQSLYEECVRRKYWMLAYLAGRVLSLAHMQLANLDESERLALEIYDMSSRESLTCESQAEYHLGHIRSARATVEGNPSMPHKLREIVDWLLTTIPNNDNVYSDPEELEIAADKLCLIASLELEMSRDGAPDEETLVVKAMEAIARARLLAKSLPDDESSRINANCDDLLVIQLLHDGRRGVGNGCKEVEAIRICDRLIAQHQSRGPKFTEAMKHQMRANCQLQRAQKETDLEKRATYLGLAEADILQAESLLTSIRSRQQVMVARHSLCRLYLMAKGIYRGLVSNEAVLHTLQGLESACDMLRRELSALGSLEALRQKQKFVAVNQVRDLYQWAISVSIGARDEAATWWWSQKRKARSLSDILGIGIMVPAAVRERIAQDNTAAELYQKLVSLQTALSTAAEIERVYIRQNLEETEDEIRNHDAFREFILLRDGAVRSIDDLEFITVSHQAGLPTERRIIFVDWVLHNDSVFVLTADCARPAETCKLTMLPFGKSYMDEWTRQHWRTTEGRRECLQRDNTKDPSKPMRQLDRLITPVVDASKPGDLLIFSPTGFLSSLPLHALRVNSSRDLGFNDNRYLIERNPVVYAPSVSILQICLTRSREARGLKSRPSVFFGIMDDAEHEAQLIYEQLEGLAMQDESSRAFCGNRATKETFTKVVPGAGLIHYHGHCRFAVDNPLKQCLVLASGDPGPGGQHSTHQHKGEAGGGDSSLHSLTTQPRAQSGDPRESAEANPPKATRDLRGAARINPQLENMLSTESVPDPGSGHEVLLSLQEDDNSADNLLLVPEVFNLSLTAPLVVLIGCDSASQLVSTGDEYLGLITGLLCAGAASVIGASWPIPSAAGRAFSGAFYATMASSGLGGHGMIDLAEALQEAALTVMDDPITSAPYYWAGFCLYGSWVFRK